MLIRTISTKLHHRLRGARFRLAHVKAEVVDSREELIAFLLDPRVLITLRGAT